MHGGMKILVAFLGTSVIMDVPFLFARYSCALMGEWCMYMETLEDAKEQTSVKLGVLRWAAQKMADTGNRIAHMCHNGWVHKAISNKRLAKFVLISV